MVDSRSPRRISTVGAIFWGAAVIGYAQTPLEFEAASVKAAPAGERGGPMRGGPGTPDPGRFTQQSTLRVLAATAYGVQGDQVTGPDWINSSLYSVDVRVPEGATRDQFRLMYQKLLAERFQMKAHHQAQPAEGYDLVIGKGGFKLKEIPPAPNSAPNWSGHFGPDGAVLTYERIPFSLFVNDLNSRIRPAAGLGGPIVRVTDKTGITGNYSFTLRYSPSGSDAPDNDIFGAIGSELGLKLVPVKITVDTIIIDHAERTPTEN